MPFSFLSYAVTQQGDSDGDGHESGAQSRFARYVGEVMQCGKRSYATVGALHLSKVALYIHVCISSSASM